MWPAGGSAHVWVCPSTQTLPDSSHQHSQRPTCVHTNTNTHRHGCMHIEQSHCPVLEPFFNGSISLHTQVDPGYTPGSPWGKPQKPDSALQSPLYPQELLRKYWHAAISGSVLLSSNTFDMHVCKVTRKRPMWREQQVYNLLVILNVSLCGVSGLS